MCLFHQCQRVLPVLKSNDFEIIAFLPGFVPCRTDPLTPDFIIGQMIPGKRWQTRVYEDIRMNSSFMADKVWIPSANLVIKFYQPNVYVVEATKDELPAADATEDEQPAADAKAAKAVQGTATEDVEISQEYIKLCLAYKQAMSAVESLKGDLVKQRPVFTSPKDIFKVNWDKGLGMLHDKNPKDAAEYFQKCIDLKIPDSESHGRSSASAYYNLACCYAQLAQTDDAIKALTTAIAIGYDRWMHMIDDSDLDSIKDTPAFVRLVSQMYKKYPKDRWLCSIGGKPDPIEKWLADHGLDKLG